MIKFWKKRIIDLYIIKEVLMPFLVGVAIIAVIMLSSFLFQLTDLIIIKKIPLFLVSRLLLYQLPEIIVQTFPISILFATMSGLGRLNRESEFTALRMGGVSLYRLILPLIFLGLFVSGMTYFLNEEVVPWSNHEAQNIIRRSILKEALPDIKENVFFKGPAGRLFYVSRYDEERSTLERVVVYNFPEKNGYPEIITAKEGKVLGNRWQLEGGIIHQYDAEGHLTLESQFKFMEFELAKDLENFFGEQRTSAEMSRKKLKTEIDLFKNSGINVDALLVDYHLKLAMPLTALIFILIGTPLSLSNKDSRSASIVLTIVIVFLYYLLLSFSRSYGRNGGLLPLLSAWLPNLIFGLIGIILLMRRESWQSWLSRVFPFFTIVFLLFFVGVSVVQAESNNFKIWADHLQYKGEIGELEANGNISSQYQKFHIRADKLIIKLDNGSEVVDNNPQEIYLNQSCLTGCDLEDPHYFFKAKELTIYPDDHLEAKNVTFWELNGRLPLFYWPYLYISLKKEEQHLIPEVGYNARRGWFIKTTYYYWYEHRLPGEFYLDYYTKSGYGTGFKQHFLYQPDLKAFLYLYGQENRTDLLDLYQWQGAVVLNDQGGKWKTDTNLNYTYYQNYSYLKGKLNLRNWGERQQLKFNSQFNSKNYFLTDNNDDKKLKLDFNYGLTLAKDWYLKINYNQNYLLNPEDGLKKRWGSKSYLAKSIKDLNLKILLERYDPKLSAEDEVRFYRWPELNLKYYPRGDLDYNFILGRYYEDISETKGYRGLGKVVYDHRWNLTKNISLKVKQGLTGRYYEVISDLDERKDDENNSYLASYQSYLDLKTNLNSYLSWNNRYDFVGFRGETPFKFDKVNNVEKISSSLNYLRGGLSFKLGSGYDLYNLKYLPLKGILNWQVNPNWRLSLGTFYNLNTLSYGDLAFISKYKDELWQINTAFKMDLNNNYLRQLDNKLIYDLTKEWYLELNTSFNYETNIIKKANMILKKNFHCRELWFTYDYLENEFMIEYHLNLFPDYGIKFGSTDDEPFMFDLGIKDLLGL